MYPQIHEDKIQNFYFNLWSTLVAHPLICDFYVVSYSAIRAFVSKLKVVTLARYV